MDINIHITGLEPLANAITKLAEAYTESGQIAQEAITKAAGKGSRKAAAVKEESPAPESAAPAANASTVESPAVTAPETSTADSPAEATSAQAGGEENPTQASTSETPTSGQASSAPAESGTASAAAASTAEIDAKLTDEALRALAGEKVKTNKDKVKALVNQYAPSLSEIPVAKRAEFRKALEAL